MTSVRQLSLINETFIVYIALLSLDTKIMMYLAQKTQIVLLIAKNVTVLTKYINFVKVFLKKLTIKLIKHFNINKYAINLKLNK